MRSIGTQTRSVLVSFLMAGSGLPACSDASTPAGNGADSADDEPSAPDAAAPSPDEGFAPLLTGDWTVPPGSEDYLCVRHTVEEDLLVAAFEAINPVGTHHTLLTAGPPDVPDGIAPCDAGTNHRISLYGSGVGTNPMVFPDGVAVRIPAGTQLLLNLHLFNTSAEPLSGTSGTRFRRLDEDDLVEEAEGILAGTVALEIPPGATTTHEGTCEMSHDVTVFALSPHMHQIGTHMRIFAERAGGEEILLHDAPYDFDEQLYYMIEPLRLSEGERVRIECTHENPTERTIRFGDGSEDEMCLAGIYRYPARGSAFFCAPG